MKLAASNIAWTAAEELAAAELLTKWDFKGVEVAPPRVWQDPLKASPQQIRQYREFWNGHGIDIISLQSLLFGRPDLTIFDNAAARGATLDHLMRMIDLAHFLGARVLVFGSPKNRMRGQMELAKATDIATDFFRELGGYAHVAGCCFCIEPNAKQYGCDFITNTPEGIAFVNKVAGRGFGLHLDAGVITLNQEISDETIKSSIGVLKHFHISEPYLEPLGTKGADHDRLSTALRDAHYEHWVSIEMRSDPKLDNLKSVNDALTFASGKYNH